MSFTRLRLVDWVAFLAALAGFVEADEVAGRLLDARRLRSGLTRRNRAPAAGGGLGLGDRGLDLFELVLAVIESHAHGVTPQPIERVFEPDGRGRGHD